MAFCLSITASGFRSSTMDIPSSDGNPMIAPKPRQIEAEQHLDASVQKLALGVEKL
jgi:hypothetical protein